MTAPLSGAVFLSDPRANAVALFDPDFIDLDQELNDFDPTYGSSSREPVLSRTEVDRFRSNVGPASVHFPACKLMFIVLRERLGGGHVKRVSRELDVPIGTVKKWFLGQNGPNAEHLFRIHEVYGALLQDEGRPA